MEFAWGVVLVLLGGVLEGLFSLGVTRTPRWKWEHVWGVGSLIALVVVPWPLAWLTVPDLGRVLWEAGWGTIAVVFGLGVGWGLGGVFWGKAIAAMGMALGVSLLMGLINVFGGPTPLWIFHPDQAGSRSAIVLYAAVAVMIAGIVVIARAGERRRRDLESTPEEIGGGGAVLAKPRTRFAAGLMLCVTSGALSACVNLGLVYGNEIGHMGQIAARHGAPAWAQSFVIWTLVFTGNYSVNFLYALYTMIRRGNVGELVTRGDATHWFWAAFLGLAWPIGIVLFGIGAGSMGELGAYAGFPMMLLIAVLAGNLAGALQGEWRGSSPAAQRMMLTGVVILAAAFAVLGYSTRLAAAAPAPPAAAQPHHG